MTSKAPNYSERIFISYSRADRYFAYELIADLLNHGYPVWLDSLNITIGDSLLRTLELAVEQSARVLVLVSADAMSSGWVERELAWARDKERPGNNAILPVLTSAAKLPRWLSDRLWVDLSVSYNKGLDDLLDALAKIGIGETHLASDQLLIPLQFTRGVHLRRDRFHARLQTVASRDGISHLRADQFWIVPDPQFEELRTRAQFRLDHLADDKYYSPEFEEGYRARYADIRLADGKLRTGVQALATNLWVDHRSSIDDSCYWFGRLIRCELLDLLTTLQTPDRSDNIHPYATECKHHLLTDESAAQFFGVEEVDRCDIFSDEESFSVWLDAKSPAFSAIRYGGYFVTAGAREVLTFDDWSKFVFPQLIYRHISGGTEPRSWTLEGYKIGVH
jgi:hypothetical protein